MKAIWKFQLAVDDIQLVEMPRSAEILCVQVQGKTPCLWAIVDIDEPRIPRRIVTRGTGHLFFWGGCGAYIGTYQLHGGSLIFHVFDEPEDSPDATT